MGKHKHHKRSALKSGPASLQQPQMQTQVDMTPGRAPTEGGEMESPSHERWEQDTFDRDPVEG